MSRQVPVSRTKDGGAACRDRTAHIARFLVDGEACIERKALGLYPAHRHSALNVALEQHKDDR